MNEGMLSSNATQGLIQDNCRSEQPCEVRNDCAVETPQNANKIRQINIEEVNRGFIVRVGCHTFAISTKVELTTKLTEYINEPDKTEKKWYDKTLF
jgi:hypothetical protein